MQSVAPLIGYFDSALSTVQHTNNTKVLKKCSRWKIWFYGTQISSRTAFHREKFLIIELSFSIKVAESACWDLASILHIFRLEIEEIQIINDDNPTLFFVLFELPECSFLRWCTRDIKDSELKKAKKSSKTTVKWGRSESKFESIELKHTVHKKTSKTAIYYYSG